MSLKFYVTDYKGSVSASVKGPYVHLKKDAWNDYSFETQFYFDYYNDKGVLVISTSVKIAFNNEVKIKKTNNLNELNYIKFIDSEFSQLDDGYFSVGASESYYKDIQKLGDETRTEILTLLNDLAFHPEIYERVKKLDLSVFKTSLMRNYDEEDFVNRIRRIAEGGKILTPYDFEFIYSNKKEVGFNVRPECFPPTNTHILIGSNGVGKTYFLNTIITEYFNKNNKQKSISDLLKLIVVSFSPFDRLFDGVDENLISLRNYSYIGLRENPTAFKVSNFKNSQKIEEEFATSLWNCATSLSLRRRWRMMADILSIDSYFRNTELKDFIGLIKENELEEEKINIFPEIKKLFKGFSSGHKIILLSLTKLVELTIEKSLILYDEPETFLHPPLISAYMRALSWLLIDRNAVAIIATHSPIILQEVPKKCVWIIKRDGDSFNILRPDRETFGESVSTLTREIFNVELRKTGFYKTISEKVKKILNDNYGFSNKNEINIDIFFNLVMDEFNNEVGSEGQSMILSEIYRQISEV